jgi:hypothetical protein
MFCPKCSQKQVSDETRFCSRCGFQLNVVKALLSNESLSQNTEMPKSRRSFSKRDMTVGAALMFVFAFIVAAITVGVPPASSAPIVFLIIAWFILVLLINIKPIIQYFLRPDSPAIDVPVSKTSPNLFSKSNSNVLPAAHSIPAEELVMPSFNTAEMVQPLSVTEPTTNLLSKKDDSG